MKTFDLLKSKAIGINEMAVIINSVYNINPKKNIVNGRFLTNSTIDFINKTDKIFKNELTREANFLNMWLDEHLKVDNFKKEYIHAMKKNNKKPIDILFVSEAPPLKFIDNKLHSKYIFGSDKSIGAYRTAPYNAIKYVKEKKKKYSANVSNTDLINLFDKYNVGFLDLIPIPMPNPISTDLRDHWSSDTSGKSKEPIVVQMLNHAIDNFKNETERMFNEDLIIVLMMPVKTALGIIDYCISYDKIDNSFIGKYKNSIIKTNTNTTKLNSNDTGLKTLALRLHKQVVSSDAGSPHVSLIINALS